MTLLDRIADMGIPYRLQQVAKHQILVHQGEVASHLFFVQRGALRMGHLSPDGKEITTQFFFEGSQVALIDSFLHQISSDYFLESMEAGELLVVERSDFMQARADNEELKQLVMDLVVTKMTTYSRLFLSRIQLSPEQRYLELRETYADLLERVEDQYLASYLGITPVSFSRIKKRLT